MCLVNCNRTIQRPLSLGYEGLTLLNDVTARSRRRYPPNGGNGSFAGVGRNVMENYGADSGEGYEASSSATPFYSWGALTGFIGLQANGFYDPIAP